MNAGLHGQMHCGVEQRCSLWNEQSLLALHIGSCTGVNLLATFSDCCRNLAGSYVLARLASGTDASVIHVCNATYLFVRYE